MIKTGIISADETTTRLGQNLQKFGDITVIGLLAGHNILTEKMLYFQAEALIKESQLSYFDKTYPSFELIKHALRNQNNLFFNKIPILEENELKLLINLSQEADAKIQLAAPLIFNSQNLSVIEKIKAPFLANISLSNSLRNLDESDFLQVLLMLVLMDNGDFRKADLMTIPDENGKNILEARLVFRSGSVARILLSNHFGPDETGIELFKAGSKAIRIQAEATSFTQTDDSEQNATRNLLLAIRNQQAINLNFAHLYQATQIFRNLKSKTSYSDGLFGKKRFVG